MEYPKTEAIRPVSAAVNRAVGDLPKGAFNFGLYFQKWFYVVKGRQDDVWKRMQAWSCSGMDESQLTDSKQKEDFRNPNILLDNLQVSLALFKGQGKYKRECPNKEGKEYKKKKKDVFIKEIWRRNDIQAQLDARHDQFEACARTYERMGYAYLKIEADLLAALVVGLGNEHPTEKGFRFDWTTGIPAISSSSVKGVIRLAYMVNELNEKDEGEAENFWWEVLGGKMSKAARDIFGCGEAGGQKAGRGKVIFLDAFPKSLPFLKAEIMNCHYPDYLNKDQQHREFRGPTEDQQPNPQRYWAVDSWLDQNASRRLKFVFRAFVPREIAADQTRMAAFEAAFSSALNEHGFGAKTAIGHGRFESGEKAPAAPVQPVEPPKDPEEVRREKLEDFKKDMDRESVDDLPGKIEGHLQKIRAQEDELLKKEMCGVLVQKARQLKKKKAFSKALAGGKAWAASLKELCDECGVSI